MIGTIRKHSKVLWGITIPAIIISFVIYFAPSSRMGGGGVRSSNDLGSINGKKITPDAYLEARKLILIFFSEPANGLTEIQK